MRNSQNPEHFISDRIVVSPNIVHGKPRIAGTRIMVYLILDLLANGKPIEKIIAEDYPNITEADVLACLEYASDLIREERIFILP